MTTELLPCVELGPEQAEYSIIWLHGLGANGHDFEPIVPELQLPASANIRFIFPHAPQQPAMMLKAMNGTRFVAMKRSL